jgi:hypothetical protein
MDAASEKYGSMKPFQTMNIFLDKTRLYRTILMAALMAALCGGCAASRSFVIICDPGAIAVCQRVANGLCSYERRVTLGLQTRFNEPTLICE